MATVTVTIRLRRTEGRNPVDPENLADAVAQALAELDPIEVDDVENETATYEVTQVQLRPHAQPVEQEPKTPTPCAFCGQPITWPWPDNIDHGRPKLYCSDACRQAAYRHRSKDTAAFNRIMGEPRPQ